MSPNKNDYHAIASGSVHSLRVHNHTNDNSTNQYGCSFECTPHFYDKHTHRRCLEPRDLHVLFDAFMNSVKTSVCESYTEMSHCGLRRLLLPFVNGTLIPVVVLLILVLFFSLPGPARLGHRPEPNFGCDVSRFLSLEQ